MQLQHFLSFFLKKKKKKKKQQQQQQQQQHLLSWNKGNIKHSCKSQLYKY